ncbi:hypothetical protein GCM10009524_33690 [Spirilliplanes yamanashiensis]
MESTAKKAFAWVYDWPGWCRSGRTEEAAIAALADYADRYRVVAERAGLRLPKNAADTMVVDERLPGDASTDFGIPGAIGADDRRAHDRRQADRLLALVVAAWEVLDETAATSPEQLRKGPRGGGRDRTKMVAHVLEAEAAYARKFGVKHKPPAVGDAAAIAALRDELLAALRAPSDGSPPHPTGWPARYVIRRVAWHALDHAWEMQDRSD